MSSKFELGNPLWDHLPHFFDGHSMAFTGDLGGRLVEWGRCRFCWSKLRNEPGTRWGSKRCRREGGVLNGYGLFHQRK